MRIGEQQESRPDDRGFSLVELMVVVMIVALLLAIGLPSFLGFRAGAQDSAAQASLSTAEKAATAVLVEAEQFPSTAALLVRMPTIEPSLQWLDHLVDSTGPTRVSIAEDDGGAELSMAVMSESGTCFYQRLVATSVTVRHHVEDAATCNAHSFRDGAGAGW
jgi:type IV pilus assembly protein PilA